MISVIIPTLNVADRLAACLSALVPAAVDGIVSEVIIADGGSNDATRQIADDAGCTLVDCPVRGRGHQLREGAARARHPWLLFLHADTILEPGWETVVQRFINEVGTGQRPPSAAAFRFALDDGSRRARWVERGVAVRCHMLKLPFGDQGLLIPRSLYDTAGGYPPLPLMEDVALIRALPRGALQFLPARATTSAERYRRDGYLRRIVTNWSCLALYSLGVPIERIAARYQGKRTSQR